MEACKEQEIGSGWLIDFFLVIICLLFVFGYILTAIVGIIV